MQVIEKGLCGEDTVVGVLEAAKDLNAAILRNYPITIHNLR